MANFRYYFGIYLYGNDSYILCYNYSVMNLIINWKRHLFVNSLFGAVIIFGSSLAWLNIAVGFTVLFYWSFIIGQVFFRRDNISLSNLYGFITLLAFVSSFGFLSIHLQFFSIQFFWIYIWFKTKAYSWNFSWKKFFSWLL